VLALSLSLFACSQPAEETPPDMQELTWMLLRDFATDSAPGEADQLKDWIDGEIDAAEAGYVLDTPGSAYVDELTFSDNLELGQMAGAMVFARVTGTVDDYAAVVPEADQSFADSSYVKWDRSIANGSEDDYLAGGELVADDAIEQNEGFGVVLPYPMLRDYRWVDLASGTGQLTRSVIYEEGWADDDHTNGILGGFTIEAWYPDGDGMIWMNATWTEVISVLGDAATDTFYSDQIIDGSTAVMVGTEAYVNGTE
jgi:hypothetical protein